MRAVLQRVKEAAVSVDGRVIGRIGHGYMVLLGFGQADSVDMIGGPLWKKFMTKILELRLFPDDKAPINASLADHGGGILVVSQFTLYGDVRKGRRPSFSSAAAPDAARTMYDAFVRDLSALWPEVARGEFGADMDVSLVNWGPVTLLLDSRDL